MVRPAGMGVARQLGVPPRVLIMDRVSASCGAVLVLALREVR